MVCNSGYHVPSDSSMYAKNSSLVDEDDVVSPEIVPNQDWHDAVTASRYSSVENKYNTVTEVVKNIYRRT